MRHKSATLLAATGFCILAASASAQTPSCGETYTVRAGDSLSQIAQWAYGDTGSYSLIYSANAETIGGNPGNIQTGQKLFIPCLDEPLAASSADPGVFTIEETTEALPAPPIDRPIRVLTATGWAPFLDEDQAQGGLLTEIINLSLQNAEGKPEYKIDFINDLGAHLNPLIADHAYDLTIGLSRPDCDKVDGMADESLFRCNNLFFSEPLFEDVLGYYSLASMPLMQTHAELAGSRICRPEAYTIAPLEAEGMVEPIITLVRAPDEATCIDYLMSDQADVALVAVDVADGRIAELSASTTLQLHEALTYVDVLYAVTSQTNPRAEEVLAAVNSGLQDIKTSGVWFQTVRRHMSEFRARQGS